MSDTRRRIKYLGETFACVRVFLTHYEFIGINQMARPLVSNTPSKQLLEFVCDLFVLVRPHHLLAGIKASIVQFIALSWHCLHESAEPAKRVLKD